MGSILNTSMPAETERILFVWSCKMYEWKIENCGSHLIFQSQSRGSHSSQKTPIDIYNWTNAIAEIPNRIDILNMCVE